jgi:hypothetical protein
MTPMSLMPKLRVAACTHNLRYLLRKTNTPQAGSTTLRAPRSARSELPALPTFPCVYQKLKLGRSGDEVRLGWQVT